MFPFSLLCYTLCESALVFAWIRCLSSGSLSSLPPSSSVFVLRFPNPFIPFKRLLSPLYENIPPFPPPPHLERPSLSGPPPPPVLPYRGSSTPGNAYCCKSIEFLQFSSPYFHSPDPPISFLHDEVALFPPQVSMPTPFLVKTS